MKDLRPGSLALYPCVLTSQPNFLDRPTFRFAAHLGAGLRSLSLFCAAVLAMAALPARGQVGESVVPLAEHTPRQVLEGTAMRVGHYSPEQKLRLALAIKPPHMAEEEQFLRDLTNKKSPNFHHFLTAEQWNARFSPSVEDEQKVVEWAQSQGLTVTQRYPNRLIVDVEAPAGVIEKALHVTINSYSVRDSFTGREEVDYSNDRDPAMPASMSSLVTAVMGLNNIQRMHPSKPEWDVKGPDYAAGPVHAAAGSVHADAISKGTGTGGGGSAQPLTNDGGPVQNLTNGNLDPSDIYSSQTYNYNGLRNLGHCCNPFHVSGPVDGGSPAETSIAIAAWGDWNTTDYVAFANQYGLAYNLHGWYIDGQPSGGPNGETMLDSEWTTATANSFGSWADTAHIYVYMDGTWSQAGNADMYNRMISDNYARVFTTSWSCTEDTGCSSTAINAWHTIFNSMLGQGWTLMTASGDRGSTDDCYFNTPAHTSVAYPASDPDFVAVGGTSLILNPDGTWKSESAWQGGTSSYSCYYNNGGSGGGQSVHFSRPSYQNYYSAATGRLVPDISLNAWGGMEQNYYFNGTLSGTGGTSIASPEIAGFFAQENAYLLAVGNVCGTGSSACAPIGDPHWALYDIGIYGSGAHVPFYDITAGCNSNDQTSAYTLTYYCAHGGYDLVTGFGTANMLQLAWDLNWLQIPAAGHPSVTFTGPTTGTWHNTDQTVSWTVSDSGGSYPSSGVAGFTQGWDSIPADSTSKAHGGTNDSFYWGPQYPNYTTGCLSFHGAGGCVGGYEGCHTVHVRGWDNQGQTTGDQTYGPVCVDTNAPSVAFSNSPVLQTSSNWAKQSVQVTVTSSDPSPGSGIYATWYIVDAPSSGCAPPYYFSNCSVYSGPVTISGEGAHYIYTFTEDNAGNFSAEPFEWVRIDMTPPTTTAVLGGTVYSGTTYKSAVKIALNATDSFSGVFHKYYQLDGGSTTTYSGSPFIVSTLGSHTLTYWSKDVAGNIETAKTLTFTIDSPTTATLVSSLNPSILGQSVKLTATLAATLSGTPTGTVTFWDGATNLGTRTLSGGVATFITNSLIVGVHNLKVTYPTTGNYLSSSSSALSQTVYRQSALTSPAPSSVLAGPKVTFTWSAPAGATGYGFRLGTTVGGSDIYGSGLVTSTSATVSNLPTNGSTVYARLFTHVGSDQAYTDYVFTAAKLAALTTPAPGSTLAGSTVTFSWSAGTGSVTGYVLKLGTTVGGSDLYNPVTTTSTSATVHNLPTNGSTIYARLITEYGSTWISTDYTYTAQ